MKHCPTCTCCVDNATALRDECGRLGIVIRWPDLVAESGAAQLLGYSGPDTLRKQCTDRRNLLEFVRRGNRRFYSLAAIAAYIENAENAEKAGNFGIHRPHETRDNEG